MKVLLTHAYFMQEDAKEAAIMKPYPPLGLLYLSAFLNEHHIDNEVFDTTFSTQETLSSFLVQNKPQIVAFYANLMTKVKLVQLMAHTRELLPDCHIVVGGPDVTYNSQNYLQCGADFVVIGEGEETLLELSHFLLGEQGEEALEDIAGLAYLGNGEEVRTKARIKIRDIDSLPVPNRKAIDLENYLDVWKAHHGGSSLNVSTQRGCPYTCKWCSTAVYGQSYRRRSPSLVVDELEQIKKEYGPDAIWFVDDVFTVSHKWIEGFHKEVKERGLDIKYECITRAERLNDHILGLLRDSGCFRIWIGAESGSQDVIDAMDRRVDVEVVREMIIKARQHNIETGTFIMIGYPGETEKDIEETIRHLKVSDPDHFTITVAYPIKGTQLYNEIEHLQTVDLDWKVSTDRDRDFRRTYSRQYYNYALRKIINEVNLHKKRQKNKELITSAWLKAKVIAAEVGMKWERIRGGN